MNGELENKWNSKNKHWTVVKYHNRTKNINNIEKIFAPQYYLYFQNDTIYFPSEEIAQRAIDEIIIPFIKKHPDFVW